MIKISNTPRTIYESSQFRNSENNANEDVRFAIREIKSLLKNGNSGGNSINQYMSDLVRKKPDYYDKTLMAGHIHHLHLDKMGIKPRSGELLFIWLEKK